MENKDRVIIFKSTAVLYLKKGKTCTRAIYRLGFYMLYWDRNKKFNNK